MNEDIRLKKMEFYKRYYEYKVKWYRNFLRGICIWSIPLALVSLLRRRTNYGVPLYFNSFWYKNMPIANNLNFINQKVLMIYVPTTLFMAWYHASYFTPRDHIEDEYFTKYTKTILPY